MAMRQDAEKRCGFLLPPNLFRPDGTKRRVGFEIEFSGLSMEGIASLLERLFGGKVQRFNPYKLCVRDTVFGTFAVGLDFRLLKETLLKEKLGALGFGAEEDLELISVMEEVLASFSEIFVPYEIATPPIPIDKLAVLNTLESELRSAGAKGTGAVLHYAFGLHINPDVPSLEAATILQYLRAFLLLYEWIVQRTNTDLLRQIAPFISPFEREYVELVLDPHYRPQLALLISDYLLFNPTRNRPLDLLPLFMLLDEKRVKTAIDDPRVTPRPTFHYRLPDCRIDEPGDDICEAWNYWVAVEKVANDAVLVSEMSKEYLAYLHGPFSFLSHEWPDRIDRWLA
jgi:hypothetical protein